MAIDLMALEPQRISKNLRGKYVLLFGLPGVGKTSLAAQFENVLIAGFEMGTNALNNVYVQPVKTWKDWREMVKQLCKSNELKEKYHSIAIDTADEAWELCSKWICGQNGVERLGELPYGQGYDLAKKEYAQTFRDLAYSGYGLIFTSHSVEKTYKNEKGNEYTMLAPALAPRPFDIINKMVDIIGYIREVNVGTEEEPNRERLIFFRDEVGDRFLAKSRYQYIKPYIKLSYKEFVDAIYEAIDAEVTHTGGEATNDKNPYITKSFDELMDEAKIMWGQIINKNLAEKAAEILQKEFGKPIKFSEILPEQTEQLSHVLREIQTIL